MYIYGVGCVYRCVYIGGGEGEGGVIVGLLEEAAHCYYRQAYMEFLALLSFNFIVFFFINYLITVILACGKKKFGHRLFIRRASIEYWYNLELKKILSMLKQNL